MATVTKRGDRYRIRAFDGYTANGKQIVRSKTWKPPAGMSSARIEKELERIKVHFEDEIRNGLYAQKHIRFKDFAEKWFKEYAEVELAPKTVAEYRFQIREIYAKIGDIYLDKLRPHHLIELRDSLLSQPYKPKYFLKGDFRLLLKKHGFHNYEQFAAASGISINTLTEMAMHRTIRADTAAKAAATLNESLSTLFAAQSEGTLSANTVKHYMRLTSSILSKAVDWQYIPTNPMDRVSMPKQEKKEQLCLNKQQAARLLNLLEGVPSKYRTAITILLLTGIRREEALALHWNDIDFKQCLVSIHGAVQYIPGKGILYGDTKTTSSNRVIKVATNAMQALDRFRQEQMADAKTLGVDWDESRYVFESLDGHLLRPDTLTSWFRRFILKTDLPPIHIHSLRHTTATLLIERHMPLTAIAGNLGHATPNTTASIYAHALKTATAATADAMDDILATGNEK